MHIADDLCQIQNAIREKRLQDQSEILHSFRKIEESLGGWANPASDPEYIFEPAVDPLDEPEAVWQGVFHVYKSHLI